MLKVLLIAACVVLLNGVVRICLEILVWSLCRVDELVELRQGMCKR